MEQLIEFYTILSWLLLASLMWSDWYEDRKPINEWKALLVLTLYIIFLPIIWLGRIGRK